MYRFIVFLIWLIYIPVAMMVGNNSNFAVKVLLIVGALCLMKPSVDMLRKVEPPAISEDEEPSQVVRVRRFNSDGTEFTDEQRAAYEQRQEEIRQRREQKDFEKDRYRAERLYLEDPTLDRSKLPAIRPLGTSQRGRLNKIPGLKYYRRQVIDIVTRKGVCTDGRWEATVDGVLTREPTNPHDVDAIAIHVGRARVGYIARAKAKEINENLRVFENHGYRLIVDVVLTWEGTEGGAITGRLRLPVTTKLLPPKDE